MFKVESLFILKTFLENYVVSVGSIVLIT